VARLAAYLVALFVGLFLAVPAMACTGGPDYASANVEFMDFRGADLACADFSGASASSARFDGANIAGADFTDANLVGATLTDARGPDANFSNANMEGATLTDGVFVGASFAGATFKWASARGAVLAGADFTAADTSFSDFTGSDLFGADLTDTIGPHAAFAGADLSCSILTGATFPGATFGGANLSRATGNGSHNLMLSSDFGRDADGWYAFDYDSGPPVYQGRRPLIHMDGYAVSEDDMWGVDVPDDNAVFIQAQSSVNGNVGVNGARLKARIRAGKGLDLKGGELNYSVLSPDGTRYRTPIAVSLSETEWTDIDVVLTPSLDWFVTYVRPGTTQKTVAHVLDNGRQLAFMWHGFSAQPTGSIEIDSFSLELTPAATSAYEARWPIGDLCILPMRAAHR
jgi:hypothetical protein